MVLGEVEKQTMTKAKTDHLTTGAFLWGDECYAVQYCRSGGKSDFRTGRVVYIDAEGVLTMERDAPAKGATMRFWPNGTQCSPRDRFRLCTKRYYKENQS